MKIEEFKGELTKLGIKDSEDKTNFVLSALYKTDDPILQEILNSTDRNRFVSGYLKNILRRIEIMPQNVNNIIRASSKTVEEIKEKSPIYNERKKEIEEGSKIKRVEKKDIKENQERSDILKEWNAVDEEYANASKEKRDEMDTKAAKEVLGITDEKEIKYLLEISRLTYEYKIIQDKIKDGTATEEDIKKADDIKRQYNQKTNPNQLNEFPGLKNIFEGLEIEKSITLFSDIKHMRNDLEHGRSYTDIKARFISMYGNERANRLMQLASGISIPDGIKDYYTDILKLVSQYEIIQGKIKDGTATEEEIKSLSRIKEIYEKSTELKQLGKYPDLRKTFEGITIDKANEVFSNIRRIKIALDQGNSFEDIENMFTAVYGKEKIKALMKFISGTSAEVYMNKKSIIESIEDGIKEPAEYYDEKDESVVSDIDSLEFMDASDILESLDGKLGELVDDQPQVTNEEMDEASKGRTEPIDTSAIDREHEEIVGESASAKTEIENEAKSEVSAGGQASSGATTAKDEVGTMAQTGAMASTETIKSDSEKSAEQQTAMIVHKKTFIDKIKGFFKNIKNKGVMQSFTESFLSDSNSSYYIDDETLEETATAQGKPKDEVSTELNPQNVANNTQNWLTQNPELTKATNQVAKAMQNDSPNGAKTTEKQEEKESESEELQF